MLMIVCFRYVSERRKESVISLMPICVNFTFAGRTSALQRGVRNNRERERQEGGEQ